jgi:hypothetical protein
VEGLAGVLLCHEVVVCLTESEALRGAEAGGASHVACGQVYDFVQRRLVQRQVDVAGCPMS